MSLWCYIANICFRFLPPNDSQWQPLKRVLIQFCGFWWPLRGQNIKMDLFIAVAYTTILFMSKYVCTYLYLFQCSINPLTKAKSGEFKSSAQISHYHTLFSSQSKRKGHFSAPDLNFLTFWWWWKQIHSSFQYLLNFKSFKLIEPWMVLWELTCTVHLISA